VEIFLTAEAWVSLLTLTALEIVLGIDNVVFLSILSSRLPEHQQSRARKVGLALALVGRLALLFAISWVMGLTRDLVTILGQGISGRDIILAGGGLFLVAKSTHEIYDKMEVDEEGKHEARGLSFASVLVQILILDLVFSLDSVITAVGMVKHLSIMVIAMIAAMGVMLVFANTIAGFIDRHPSMKVLALSFLILVGVLLLAEAFDQHIDRGYVYFAMAFALGVELVNIRVRKKTKKPAPDGPAG
jgi:predicted tellurium resistance membrane protein TerC